mmetsp:Transcript_21943/g.72464  ORF Transcript_21943/g.72464 Transcript_21943/m.72464 type:complete len:98 (+) Transcript_21943:57-350(+)
MNPSIFKRNFSSSKWVSPDGEERSSESKVVKCRCGKSNTMPYCDNSHRHPWYRLSLAQNLRGFKAHSSDVYLFAGVFLTFASFVAYRIRAIKLQSSD